MLMRSHWTTYIQIANKFESRILCLQRSRHCSSQAFSTRCLARSKSKSHRNHQSRRPLQASLTLTTFAAVFTVAGTGYLAYQYLAPATTSESESAAPATQLSTPKADGAPVDRLAMPVSGSIPTSTPPGRPGNLTPEQEQKLKELWVEIGKITGQYPADARVSLDGRPTSPSSSTAPTDDAASTPGSTKEKKKRRFFGRSKKDDETPSGTSGASSEDVADKHGSNKEFKTALAQMSPQELRDALWGFCKGDDPDANLCRYLRARKWVVHDALVMLVSTIYWRARVMKLDEDIMWNGEEAAVRAARGDKQGTGGMAQKLGADMVKQLEMGKSYLHGVDKEGRPLCIIRARLHKGGEFSEESLERLTVYMIETARLMLRPPVDTAVLVFDMSGFTLANMDYTPVKFMIKVFEANYPESLGAVLVHKAPWVFQGIWSIIKGWLDPVVASKINFTKDITQMEEFIDVRNVPKELGGQEDWEWKYVAPREGENVQMEDKQARAEVQEERDAILKRFEQNTEDWVLGNGSQAETKSQRANISRELTENYIRLDPFIRSRSVYDRVGVIQEGGKFDPYPPADFAQKKQVTGSRLGGTVAGTRQVDGTTEANTASDVKSGPYVAGSQAQVRQSTDAQSVKSKKSVYYDAQDDLD